MRLLMFFSVLNLLTFASLLTAAALPNLSRVPFHDATHVLPQRKRSPASMPISACTFVQVSVLPLFCPFAQVLFPPQPVTIILEVSASRMHSQPQNRTPHLPHIGAQHHLLSPDGTKKVRTVIYGTGNKNLSNSLKTMEKTFLDLR
jgi:hypothetical protein